jgi:hypothetical protein
MLSTKLVRELFVLEKPTGEWKPCWLAGSVSTCNRSQEARGLRGGTLDDRRRTLTSLCGTLRSWMGGTKATGQEAEAEFQKKTQRHQILPVFAGFGTCRGRLKLQAQLKRNHTGRAVTA